MLFAPVGHMTNGVRYDRYEGVKRRILWYQGHMKEEKDGIFIWRFRGHEQCLHRFFRHWVMLSIQLSEFGLAMLHHSIF